MKKNLSLLAVLLMSSTLMVGCQQTPTEQPSEQPSEQPTSEVAPTDQPTSEVAPTVDEPTAPVLPEIEYDFDKEVNIEIYTTLSSTAEYGLYFDDALKMFEEKYGNKIKVTHTRVGGYDDVRDQLKTELGTGQGPNLAYCYPDHVALYNKARAVQTLDKFINNTQVDDQGNLLFGLTEQQVDDFIDAYYEEGRSYGDGNMYTLPLYKSTEVLYYNVDVFKQHNLEVPTHWFKDDAGLDPNLSLEHVCEVLKAAYPSDYPLGYDSEANWFITMCEQYGSPYTSATGDHFLFNNDKNKEFVTRFKEWFDKGYFTTQNIYGGYTSGLFCNTTDTTAARSFMSIGSSAGAKHQLPDVAGAFEVGIASIPQVNPDAGKVISQGPSLVMFKKADQQEVVASWLLMRFLTTDIEFQASMSMASGYVPGIEAVMENDVYLEWLDSASGTADGIAALSASVCMQQADRYFTSPAFVGSSDARDQVGSLLQSVFQGQQTVDEAFEYAISECLAGQK